jgi:glycogen operon protein
MHYPLSLDELNDAADDIPETAALEQLTDHPQVQLLRFVQNLIAFRKKHPVFHRRNFFSGDGDALWFDNSGRVMESHEWANYYAKTVMLFLDGTKLNEHYPSGESVVDNSYLIIFNGHYEEMEFVLPSEEYAMSWELVVDTMFDEGFVPEDYRYPTEPSNSIIIEQRSLRVYRAL